MTPTLLSMMLSAMLMDAFHDTDTGFDGNILNLRRLQAETCA